MLLPHCPTILRSDTSMENHHHTLHTLGLRLCLFDQAGRRVRQKQSWKEFWPQLDYWEWSYLNSGSDKETHCLQKPRTWDRDGHTGLLGDCIDISAVQFSSVAQSCLTHCDPMDCSMPGLPVHHQLLEFTQTHVHWVGDAIQPSHPLSSPSSLAFNLSWHQGLF